MPVINASQLRLPELLAPAGDWDAMRAAVANGADAVYFGLDNFNARHRAANFRTEELPEIMKYLHDHNVKGFITFNTLIFSDELEQAVDYIKAIALAGADAVIVQDLGLARLIRLVAPSLHVHASTQMTLTEPRGIEFVRRMGVERAVMARELSVADIQKIAEATPMPLEVFVHGALCVAYSGQCLTSEALGGRSANRGQCAQACRLPYDLIVDGEFRDLGDKAYLLSPQDLAAYDLIGDLAHIGVASFKIEGRLKSAHYVAATSQTYRQAIDAFAEQQQFKISPQARGDLEQTFSRGFTHGFLSGVNHQKLVTARFPKSRGRRMGVVKGVQRDAVVVELDESERIHQNVSPLKPGDGVVFDQGHPEQDEQGGRIFKATVIGKRQVVIELGRGDINIAAIDDGAIVWKTDDPALRKRLEHSFSRDTVARRIPLNTRIVARVGERLTLTFVDGSHSSTAEWEKPLEQARKFPFDAVAAREQLGRLGDTPYELADLEAEIEGDPMVPKSVLNDLRRQAVEQLLAHRAALGSHGVAAPDALTHLRADATRILAPAAVADTAAPISPGPDNAAPESIASNSATAIQLHVLTRTVEQLEAVLAWHHSARDANEPGIASVYCDFEDVRRYKDAVPIARAAGVPIAVATMRIIKPGEDGWLRIVLDSNPDAVLVRNLAAVGFFQEFAPRLPLIGDYSLNIANELTAAIFAEAGLIRMVPSYDLSWKQLAAMMTRFDPSRFECVVHQHMPMFHMEHCVFAHTLSTGKDYRDCGRPCETHKVDLRDRVGEPHPLIPDAGCRNTVFNATAQSAADYVPEMRRIGVRNFRVELLRDNATNIATLLDRYRDVLSGATEPATAIRSLRVLNQLGVTRGTLDRE